MSRMSNVEIYPDLLRSVQICQNPTRSIKILWDLSDNVKMSTKLSNVIQIVKLSIKLSKCQSNCHIVTISNVTYYQSVGIRLAHRLYSDFQYFFIGFAKILHRRFQLEAHVHDPAPHKYGKNSLAHGADSRVFLQKKCSISTFSVKSVWVWKGGETLPRGRMRWEGSGKVHHGERPHFF